MAKTDIVLSEDVGNINRFIQHQKFSLKFNSSDYKKTEHYTTDLSNNFSDDDRIELILVLPKHTNAPLLLIQELSLIIDIPGFVFSLIIDKQHYTFENAIEKLYNSKDNIYSRGFVEKAFWFWVNYFDDECNFRINHWDMSSFYMNHGLGGSRVYIPPVQYTLLKYWKKHKNIDNIDDVIDCFEHNVVSYMQDNHECPRERSIALASLHSSIAHKIVFAVEKNTDPQSINKIKESLSGEFYFNADVIQEMIEIWFFVLNVKEPDSSMEVVFDDVAGYKIKNSRGKILEPYFGFCIPDKNNSCEPDIILKNITPFNNGYAIVRITSNEINLYTKEGRLSSHEMNLINTQGEISIFTGYDNIEELSDNLYKVILKKGISTKKDRYGIINPNKNTVPEKWYDCVIKSSDERIVAIKENLIVSFDSSLISLKEVQYDSVEPFSENRALVKKDDAYGFIDIYGNEITTLNFSDAYSFCESRAIVSNNNLFGYINTEGDTVVPIKYLASTDFVKGVAIVCENYKYGLIDIDGNIVCPFIYDSIDSFSSGIAKVKSGDCFGFVNDKGVLIVPCIYKELNQFSGGVAVAKLEDKYGGINNNGDIIIPFVYDELKPFCEGFAVSRIDNHYQYITVNGEIVFNSKFELADTFNNGFARVRYNGKYCFIDKKGSTHIIGKYEYVSSFNNGFAIVRSNSRYTYINTEFKELTPFKYDEILPFGSNIGGGIYSIYAQTFFDKIYKDGDTSRESSVEIFFSKECDWEFRFPQKISRIKNGSFEYCTLVSSYSEDLAVVSKKEDKKKKTKYGLSSSSKYGYIDRKKNLVLGFNYDHGRKFIGGKAAVRKEGKYIFINKKGDVVSSEFEYIYAYNQKYSIVKYDLEQDYIILDRFQRRVARLPIDYRIGSLYDNIVSFSNKESNKYGIINIEGKVLIEPLYDDVVILNENYFKVKVANLWGVIDISNNIIVPIEFKDVYENIEYNRINANKDKDCSIYDLDGNHINTFKNSSLFLFEDDFIIVNKDGKHFICTKDGNAINQTYHDQTQYHENGDKGYIERDNYDLLSDGLGGEPDAYWNID
ncbi:WG repeat-containing protein [Saccharicrinis aurantiacus]|uniref:WG repeat-containing protein n=1 Tax=Saccharicrinis aurantiacus TaxID=1849719 RepID=UPI0024913315|nr:WG repeat-containing protein [Saccharicrinis aurantiacus]